MYRQTGIALKTFIFTSVLIILVIAVSFGILYSVLPSYYLYTKNQTLQKNAEALVLELNDSVKEEEFIQYISDFARSNNADVLSFDRHGLLLPSLSSPFFMFDASNKLGFKFLLKENAESIETNPQKNGIYSFIKLLDKKPAEESENGADRVVTFQVSGGKSGTLYYENGSKIASSIISREVHNDRIGYITINSTLQPIDEAKSVMLSLLPFLLLIAILIALFASYLYAKRLTKPILKISEATAQMKQLTPGILSDVRTNDELGLLSQNLDSLYLSLCDNIGDLKNEMEKASKLEQSKTDFMQAASHELKTPIAALKGIIEGMIDNVGIYKNREKYLRECKNLVDTLAGLTSEILNASKLENIHDSSFYEDVNVGGAIEQALCGCEPFIKEKELRISVNASFTLANPGLTGDPSDFTYTTDKKMLQTVFANLVSNAVKYTGKGGRIAILLVELEECVVFSIENECDHIAEEKLPQLFEPFFTLDYSRDKTKSGTGLGLHIVKRGLETLRLRHKIENTEIGLKFSIFFEKSAA
ncbi:sensor histidine kinase [Brevibacillus borstelensis]|uniref:sensor histidine kinase n=1 Tax=Brevibacillus borstelensis TaxID=45462 RepID=UPI0030BA9B64